MKRYTMIAAGMALVLGFCLNHSWAQTQAPPPAPATPAPNQLTAPSGALPFTPAGTNQPQLRRPFPPRTRAPRVAVQMALRDLQQVKMTLQNSQDDFGGHKESAIAACDKAAQELEAVMKAIPTPTPQQRFQLQPGGAPGAAAPPVPTPATPPPAQPPPQP